MALQGQTVIAASGDAGSEDCLQRIRGPDPDAARHRRPRIPARRGQRRWHIDDQCLRLVAVGLERLHGRGDHVREELDPRVRRRGLLPRVAGQPGATTGDRARHHPLQPQHLPGGAGLLVPGGPLGRRSDRLLERPLDRVRWHQCRRAYQRRALRRHQPRLLQPARPCRPRALCSATGQWQHLHRHHAGQQRLHQHQPRALRRRHRLRCGQRPRHSRRPEPDAGAARR